MGVHPASRDLASLPALSRAGRLGGGLSAEPEKKTKIRGIDRRSIDTDGISRRWSGE